MANLTENDKINFTYCGAGFEEFSNEYQKIHGYLSLIVCKFGSIANILNIAVLSRREMRSPTNAILTGLAVADLLVMLDYIPYAWHVYLSSKSRLDNDRFSYGWTTFVLFHSLFSQVCHTISICLTLILAIWRYIAIAYPHRNRDWCKMKNTIFALIVAYVICPVICIPLYLAVSVHEKHEMLDSIGKRITKNSAIDQEKNITESYNMTLYYVQFNQWALDNDELNKKIIFWIYSVVIKLIPCLALTILSTRLIFALLETKKRRQNLMSSSMPLQPLQTTENNDTNDGVIKIKQKQKSKNSRLLDKEKQTDRTTRMLLAVLLLFLLTEFPQGILGLLSALLGEPFFKQCYIPLGKTFILNHPLLSV